VFGGGGFGVGLTVAEVGWSWPVEAAPPPEHAALAPPRLTELMPVAGRSDAEKAHELQRVQQAKSMLAAYEAALVVGLAADRPDSLDGGPARGMDAPSPIPGASEFFVEELALITNSSVKAAARLAEESYVLVGHLPAVWGALADGELDTSRARVFVEVLGSVRAEVAGSVAGQLLPEAGGLSSGKLRARLRRAAGGGRRVRRAVPGAGRTGGGRAAAALDRGRDERAGGGAARPGGGGVLVDGGPAGLDGQARR
jgi:hypothetical protein